MGKSNSNLLNYIEHLLDEGNESALRRFVVDPITDAEGKHGLTKAERAVLRRTVAGLSNNSVNGYSIDRALSSYRRSLRLLQNVLHNVGTKMAMDAMPEQDASYYYALVLYYPNSNPNVANNYTCHDQNYLDEYGGGSYQNSQVYYVYLNSPQASMLDVMNAMRTQAGLNFSTDDPQTVVNAFTVGGNTYTANLHFQDGTVNPCYDLETNPNAHNVFWFWTINGGPGTQSESFATKIVNSGQTIYWQLIAPCGNSGFVCCHAHPQNAFGKAKAAELRGA